MKRRAWIWIGVAVFAAGYFVLDVRQRARLDRGIKRHRTDFTVYQYAARALKQGEDPYAAENPRGYRYVYPPLLAVLLQPVADWEPQDAALVFYLLSAAALLASMLMLRRMTGGTWTPVLIAGFVCLGFAHQGFQRGQVTHILLFLQVAALACLLRRRFALAGALLCFAGALRLTPLLPAAGVGLGLLFADMGDWRWFRYVGGCIVGLALGFVVLPLVGLGSVERTREVSERWLEVAKDVYRDGADLGEHYRINEWRFKNQAPRRVFGTWNGWHLGVTFEKERPLWHRTSEAQAYRPSYGPAAVVTSLGLLLAAALLGACFLHRSGNPWFPVVFTALVLLPVLITRYTWPTHYLMALPALAFAARRGAFAVSVLILFAGSALFYAAHWKPLQVLGEAGCLMIACVLFLAVFLVQGIRERAA